MRCESKYNFSEKYSSKFVKLHKYSMVISINSLTIEMVQVVEYFYNWTGGARNLSRYVLSRNIS